MQEAPEGERQARLEATMEGIARELSGLRSDIRDLRTTMRRNFLIIMGALVATWLTAILLLLVALFRL